MVDRDRRETSCWIRAVIPAGLLSVVIFLNPPLEPPLHTCTLLEHAPRARSSCTLLVTPPPPKRRIRTLGEVVAGGEPGGLQLAVRHKLDVQVSPAGVHVGGALLAAVAPDEGREAEGPVPDLDVVEFAFPGRLDGILVVEEQVDALARRGCRQRSEEKVRGAAATPIKGQRLPSMI